MGNCYNAGFYVKRELDHAKKVYVSFSGGKDSTAMLLRLIELGEQIDEIVFADTGFEFPELYAYIDKIESHIGRKIIRLKPQDKLWEKWFYGEVSRGANKGNIRGFPLFAYPCWYSRESKVLPLQKHMVDAKIIYVGIAKDEQQRCSDDDFIKYPLVEWGWTEKDCADYLNSKGLMNPLYKNYNRLGCFFCQKQSISSLYALWKTNKELWNKAKWWDEESRKISGHGIKEAPLIEYEERFNSGFVPKQEPKYSCESCDAVGSAFKIRQQKLNRFVATSEERGRIVCAIRNGSPIPPTAEAAGILGGRL